MAKAQTHTDALREKRARDLKRTKAFVHATLNLSRQIREAQESFAKQQDTWRFMTILAACVVALAILATIEVMVRGTWFHDLPDVGFWAFYGLGYLVLCALYPWVGYWLSKVWHKHIVQQITQVPPHHPVSDDEGVALKWDDDERAQLLDLENRLANDAAGHTWALSKLKVVALWPLYVIGGILGGAAHITLRMVETSLAKLTMRTPGE